MAKNALIGKEDIDEVLALSDATVADEMIEPVRKALDLFEKNVSKMAFLPAVERITIRTKTLQQLLASIRKLMPGEHKRVFKEAGEEIGASFANDLHSFLASNNKIPKDVETLLAIWNKYDSIAGWGNFKSTVNKNKITIEIEDSFLASGLNGEHPYCAFMEGYISGFLWEALKGHYRLLEKAVFKPESPPFEPVAILETKEKNKCIFEVRLQEEELEEAFDFLEAAKEAFRQSSFGEAGSAVRTSVEIALKEKIGLEKEDKASALKILDALKAKNVQLPYKAIGDIYGSTSAIIHGSKKMAKSECEELIKNWGKIIKGLELMRLPEKDEIKKAVKASANPG